MTTHAAPVLTGVVYVQGALEGDFPRRTVGRNVQCGDLRLHAHLDEKGMRARARGFCRAGYSGFIRASLYDGKAWRKFMLALYVDAGKRHFEQNADRARNAWSIILALQALKGRSCIYRDGAFACAELPVVKPEPVQPATPLPKVAVSCLLHKAKPRRRRRSKDDSRQLRLF